MTLPAFAAWRHVGARQGFEVVFFEATAAGIHMKGHTIAVEDGQPWMVGYEITLDDQWRTRTAEIYSTTAIGERRLIVEADGSGTWHVDRAPWPDLDGCLDIDLESSACTNSLPVHRMQLATAVDAEAPAAWVRVGDLGVQRLEQHYRRVGGVDGVEEYDYRAPQLNFESRLRYDDALLVLEYPGIATRVG
jgi:uncharacterized protein